MDEENDDEEGFLDINNNVFWTFNQDSDDWEQANVVGHSRTKAVKGKGKGKRRYKKKFRGRFKPFRRTGKAHFADNENDAEASQWDTANQYPGCHDSYYGKGKSQGKGGKGKPKGKVTKVTSPLEIKARRKDPLKLREKGSMVRRAKVKARLTSVQMPRTEPLLPQRLIVHHGMTNLKNYIRNIGTAADRPAGTPKIMQTGQNGLFRETVPLS